MHRYNHAAPVFAAWVSVGSYKICSADLEGLVLLMFSMLSGSHTSSTEFPELWVVGFDRKILLRAMCSKAVFSLPLSFSLSVISGCWSLYLFPSAQEEAFLMMANKALIHAYSRISIGVIYCYFYRPVVFSFTLDIWTSQSMVLPYQSSVGYRFHFRE